ncbi:PapD-like protein [Cladochytrium replicatum]|nr:PapD-like protein [Cladochytrium replicatum]
MMDSSSSNASYFALQPDRDLEFRRPFNTVVKQSLSVTNLHSTPIAFKVKTTAPKQYCVRPNSGRVRPGQSVEVHVLLQAMREDPPPDFRCKDKFLVQCIPINNDVMGMLPDDAAPYLQDLWTTAENVKKSNPDPASRSLAEKKLRVNYLPPLDPANTSTASPPHLNKSSTFSTTNNKPPSPVEEFHAAPLPRAVTAVDPSTRTPSVVSISSSAVTTTNTLIPPPQPNAQPAPIRNSVSSVTTATPAQTFHTLQQTFKPENDREVRDAKEQIKKLQATIEAYRSEVERLSSIRQRRSPDEKISGAANPTASSSSTAVAQNLALPIQVVAILCIIAFLLGATFF